jgi:hypothetical protein
MAEDVLRDIAPDELPILHQMASPPRLLDKFRSGAVGYGIETELVIVAPYVLLMITWARSIVVSEGKPIVEKRLRKLTRRVLRAEPSTLPAIPIEPDDPAAIKEAVRTYGKALGLAEDKAALLADAVIGRINGSPAGD